MATSRITLTYDPRTNGESGSSTTYWLKVTVETSPEDITTPEGLTTCLVISRGSITTAERISRIGSYDEVLNAVSPPRLPLLPTTVNYFESESFPADIAVGDVIRIPQGELPDRWTIYEYARTQYDATVAEVDTTSSPPSRVRVSTPFPTYGRSIGYSVLRAGEQVGSGTDGTANRNYTTADEYFLASEGITNYGTDLAAANAWRLAAESDAWALVKAYDTAAYSTAPETRVYEEQ